LKLGVVYKCILWISRSNLIITIFRQFYQSYAPFCISNLLNFWYLYDNLWKIRCMVCLFDTSLLKLLQNNVNIWTYKVTLASGYPWPTAFYLLCHLSVCFVNQSHLTVSTNRLLFLYLSILSVCLVNKSNLTVSTNRDVAPMGHIILTLWSYS
jgi:hypothetical protein